MDSSSSELPDLLKLDNQLCFSIYATSRAITRVYRPILARFQLTYPQYLVMLTLWEKDGQPVKEIGQRLYLDSGTLTPLLKRMEASDFLIRKRDEHDERQVTIHLTEKGQKLRRIAICIPQDLIRDSHLDLTQAMRTKVLVDQVLTKMLECSPSDFEDE